MPFKKRHLGTEIALILSSGLLLTAITSTAQAQLPQVSCRANDSGDGWICEENPTPGSTNTVPTTTRPLNNTEVELELVRLMPLMRTARKPLNKQSHQPTQAFNKQSPRPIARPIDSEPAALRATQTTQRYDLDWVPLESLSAEQLTQLDGNCCGAFVDPTGLKKGNENRPSDSDTRFDTEQGIRGISQNLISIDGDIIVQQGYRTIENNESTTIDSAENTVLMQGDVIFPRAGRHAAR